MIEIKHLTLGYGRHTLIENSDATLEAGSLTALIGRNGTGKSTLLRAIGALNRKYGGEITVNGNNVATAPAASMARSVAMVTTERIRVANLRCRDVVALGRAPYTNWSGRMQKCDEQIVFESLAAVGMSDYADKTMDKMSDGECQRIMIARALAQSTPVMLLDEPTSFLDIPNRHELCRLLARLAHSEGKCILFSTHELNIAMELCDNILLIDPPHLHYSTAAEISHGQDIERLFGPTRW